MPPFDGYLTNQGNRCGFDVKNFGGGHLGHHAFQTKPRIAGRKGDLTNEDRLCCAAAARWLALARLITCVRQFIASSSGDNEGESRSTAAVTVLGHTFRRSLLPLFSVSKRTADENEFCRPREAL